MKILKIIFLLLIILITFSFSCNRTVDQPRFSGNLLVYVEARDGINTGCCGYGDIVVYELENNIEHKITDDEFYDENPKFSPDGKYILFRSNRTDSQISRDIKGVSGALPYIYEMQTGKIKRLNFSEDKGFNPLFMDGVRNLIWGQNSETLLFIFRNEIVEYNIQTDSMYLYMEFGGDVSLNFLTVLDNYICLGYEKDIMSAYEAVVVIDYKTRKVLDNISLEYGQINGATKNGLLMQGRYNNKLSIYVYDVINKKVSEVLYTYEDKDIYDKSSSLYDPFLYGKKIFFLGIKNKSNDYIIKEVGIYDTSSEQKVWLTNNNKNKEGLDVFIRD